MNSPSEKLPFDPHLKLLAQSLVEFRTGFSESDYLEVVGEIARHLNLSHKPNCPFLAKKDSNRHLLKFLLQYYYDSVPLLYNSSYIERMVDERIVNYFQHIIDDGINYMYFGHDKLRLWKKIAKCLNKIEQRDERVINGFIKALKSQDYSVRSEATEALGIIGYADKQVINAILATVKNQYFDDEKRFVIKALVSLGESNEQVVIDMLNSMMNQRNDIKYVVAEVKI